MGGLTPSQTVIRCGKCGGSRPAGHAHCYACGARLTGQMEKRGRVRLPNWSEVRGWPVLGRAGQLFSRRARVVSYGTPVLELRTWGDKAARWYVALSIMAVAAWYVASASLALPARADGSGGVGAVVVSPSEACAWMDGQRVQLTNEAGRRLDAARGEMARRLGELAAVVGVAR